MGITEVPPISKNPSPTSNRGGGFGGMIPASDGPGKALTDPRSEPARTGIFVALAAIAMMFAAFTSAMVVREGSANDWLHLDLPKLIYFNTALMIASSVTLEFARRKVASAARSGTDKSQAMHWLLTTLALGVAFLIGQLFVWRSLKLQGIYLATNPTSSFFYVLTVFHALHVTGGLGGLVRVISIFRRPILSLRRSTIDATSYYWHFMGILWIYLLAIIVTKM